MALIVGTWCLAQGWCAADTPLVTQGADVRERIETRDFPSAFQAWNPATPLPGKNKEDMIAMHDLYFTGTGALGLVWAGHYEGDGTEFTPESLRVAARRIARLKRLNPHLLIITEVRYHDAAPDFFPKNSSGWMRDSSGQLVLGWKEGGFFKINFQAPAVREQVARQAHAIVNTGLIDGVMLDWWTDADHRLELIRAVRKAVGDKLILVNGNDLTFPLTAPYVNGTYMECWRSNTPEDWTRISRTLRWAGQATREPRINCLETWFHHSRQDLNLMRATTTMALTQSDGYCLFGDPDELPTPDHLHDWYPFWNKGLGQPVSVGAEKADKSWRREFTHGTVVYNPAGNATVTIHLTQPLFSRAAGRLIAEEQIPPCDGDILLRDPYR